MCGLFGFVDAASTNVTEKRMFITQSLVVDSLRGQGGAGVGLVDTSNRSIRTFKRGLCGTDFVMSNMFNIGRISIDKDISIVLGHNRAATVGDISDENSHPFHFKGDRGEVLFMHNGTLNGYYGLVRTPGFSHRVDSAYAAMAMASREPEEVLKEVRGVYVFVWYDAVKHTFNIARNDNRDIFFIYTPLGGLYFASEYLMLNWIMDRCKIASKGTVYSEVQDHTWLEWDIGPQGNVTGKPRAHKIEPRHDAYSPATWFGGAHYGRDREDTSARTRPVEKLITKYNIKVGQELNMTPDSFEPYNSGGNNSIYGKMWVDIMEGPETKDIKDLDKLEFLVHSVTRQEYVEYKKNWSKWLPCRVVGVSTNDKSPETIIVSIDKECMGTYKRYPELPKKEDNTSLVIGPNNAMIPIETWRALAKPGCAFCSEKIPEENFNKLVWIPGTAPQSVLCSKCGEDEEILELVNVHIASRTN